MQFVHIACSFLKRLVPQAAHSSGKKRERRSWKWVLRDCIVQHKHQIVKHADELANGNFKRKV